MSDCGPASGATPHSHCWVLSLHVLFGAAVAAVAEARGGAVNLTDPVGAGRRDAVAVLVDAIRGGGAGLADIRRRDAALASARTGIAGAQAVGHAVGGCARGDGVGHRQLADAARAGEGGEARLGAGAVARGRAHGAEGEAGAGLGGFIAKAHAVGVVAGAGAVGRAHLADAAHALQRQHPQGILAAGGVGARTADIGGIPRGSLLVRPATGGEGDRQQTSSEGFGDRIRVSASSVVRPTRLMAARDKHPTMTSWDGLAFNLSPKIPLTPGWGREGQYQGSAVLRIRVASPIPPAFEARAGAGPVVRQRIKTTGGQLLNPSSDGGKSPRCRGSSRSRRRACLRMATTFGSRSWSLAVGPSRMMPSKRTVTTIEGRSSNPGRTPDALARSMRRPVNRPSRRNLLLDLHVADPVDAGHIAHVVKGALLVAGPNHVGPEAPGGLLAGHRQHRPEQHQVQRHLGLSLRARRSRAPSL